MPVTGIDLADDTRLLPGVLAASRPLTGAGWQNGVELRLAGCAEPTIKNRCVANLEPAGVDVVRFNPFIIAASAACTPMSGMDHEARAAERLTRTTEWALGRVLATGEGTGDGTGLGDNPSLAECESVGSFTSVVQALACLEQEAANRGFGARVLLHLTARMAYLAAAAGVIRPDGSGRWVTPTGSVVVVSAGYPAGECTATTETAWATGPVWVALDQVDAETPTDWRTNTLEAWAERLAIVVFDPCLNLCVTVQTA